MKIFSFAAAGMLCIAVTRLAAQISTEPPRVLRILCEDIKEGRENAHRNNENTFMLEAATANYPAHVLGMSAITGPGQAWFLEAHDSFQAVEKTLSAFGAADSKFAQIDELDAEFRTGSRSWMAVYRPDLSFHPEEWMQSLPKARFVTVTTFHVQPGHDSEFAEMGRQAVDAYQKALSDQPVVTYQVVSGMAAGTYMLFEPTASLKSLDSEPERSRAGLAAMGDSGVKRFMAASRDAVASQESVLFVLEPRMSYVSKEFAAVDPNFWTQKIEPAAKPKPHGKAAAKPSGN